MKFKNTTHFDLRVIARIVRAVVDDSAKRYAKPARRDLIRRECEVVVRRSTAERRDDTNGYSGYGWLDGSRMTLCLPDEIRTVEFVWLVIHEVAHLYGIKHDKMGVGVRNRGMAGFRFAEERLGDLIAKVGETLPTKAKPAKSAATTADKRRAKLAALLKREAAWKTKAKRAENALKKIAKQKRYYEKALAES